MSLLAVLILAIVQGMTEFLPVSSSGHLVVANALLQAAGQPALPNLLEVEVVLHLGTLCSVLVYYRREILRLLTTDRRVVPLLIIGTIPAAVVGLTIKKGLSEVHEAQVEHQILENPLVAGLMFPVTALILCGAARLRRQGGQEYAQATWKQALFIGCLQALAILPGISRSGSTIAAGLGVGLKREAAATFAFLLAIPAILGAGGLQALDLWEQGGSSLGIDILAVGFGVSFVVGLVALDLLIRFVQRGKLAIFAWYLIPLGLAVTVWQLFG